MWLEAPIGGLLLHCGNQVNRAIQILAGRSPQARSINQHTNMHMSADLAGRKFIWVLTAGIKLVLISYYSCCC